MSEDNKIHKCEFCDYNSPKAYNLKRHMVRNHPSAKGMQTSAKSMQTSAKSMRVSAKSIQTPENICEIIDDKQCMHCNRVFTKKYNLKIHIEKCKGIVNPYECEFCNKVFKFKNNKYAHRIQCKIKYEEENNIINEENRNIQIQNITNNNIINNNNNSVTNNNNTVINQIVVFDPANMALLNDHISKKDFSNLLVNHDFTKILTDYSTALLSRKENQCVRKTNLLSASSAVHVGDNKWEYQTDKEIYPKLLSHIAGNFNEIKENLKVNIYKQLDTFVEDIMCEATDCHEDKDEELRLKKLYRRLFNNIKHLVFNLTKKELKTDVDV
jgi:hypothetical protein